ncbi:hypothetical protein BCR37DRAFT_384338 [Protomyces lactucae-debilis]|uniref:Uncharacterized protein n=1 Tax=Protomyces lactucae-debilis TaxID=2754530 RepID=A0A1Y2ESQ7_PROLT|nr:uncharacterized protein BCR37DRAFT_384338 [Protomyces lactucae-debilis]ORY74562.1 hypothetical protein BCR37DRAFT_384338 [Protomyces lactucae-debilis]
MLESFCGAAGKSSPVQQVHESIRSSSLDGDSEISNAAVAKARGHRHGSTIDLHVDLRKLGAVLIDAKL